MFLLFAMQKQVIKNRLKTVVGAPNAQTEKICFVSARFKSQHKVYNVDVNYTELVEYSVL